MKAEELQRAVDMNNMKGFYRELKEVWAPQTKQFVHLKSSDGVVTFTNSKVWWQDEVNTFRNYSVFLGT